MELYRKDEPEERFIKTDIGLDFSKLSKEERILLDAFNDTIRTATLIFDGEDIYHFGTYAEGKMCIFMADDGFWDTYFIENGKRLRRRIYDSCEAAISRALYEFNSSKPLGHAALSGLFKSSLKATIKHRDTDMSESGLKPM